MWDDRYAEPGYAYGTLPNDFLAAVAHRIPDGPVLCLGEGEGRNAVYLARQGHPVTAVDQSAVGLGKAHSLAESHGVEIETIVSDLGAFDIGQERWAGIVLIFVHLPPALRSRVHRAAVAGLRPGGLLVLEAYTKGQLELATGGPQSEALLFGLDELQRDLSGLVLEHAVETERAIDEGRYHKGRSAVVQVLARKPEQR